MRWLAIVALVACGPTPPSTSASRGAPREERIDDALVARALLFIGTPSYGRFAAIEDSEELVRVLQAHRSVSPQGEVAPIDRLTEALVEPRSERTRQHALAVGERFARLYPDDRCIAAVLDVMRADRGEDAAMQRLSACFPMDGAVLGLRGEACEREHPWVGGPDPTVLGCIETFARCAALGSSACLHARDRLTVIYESRSCTTANVASAFRALPLESRRDLTQGDVARIVEAEGEGSPLTVVLTERALTRMRPYVPRKGDSILVWRDEQSTTQGRFGENAPRAFSVTASLEQLCTRPERERVPRQLE